MGNSHQAHLAAASLNQTVGDWSGNEARIRRVIAEARDSGARLLLLPEMCVPGYSLGDRLLRVGTIERSWELTIRLLDATEGMAVAVGLPIQFEGVLYNAMALLANGNFSQAGPSEGRRAETLPSQPVSPRKRLPAPYGRRAGQSIGSNFEPPACWHRHRQRLAG